MKTAPSAPTASGNPVRRWPAVLWVPVYVASLLVLNGGHPGWDWRELGAGIVLIVVAFALSMYIAVGPWRGRPRPVGVLWLLAGVAVFYLVCAIAAAIAAGPGTALATGLAAFVPLTAVAIWAAGTRSRTASALGGLADTSAADDDSPLPAMGGDDLRPLGDTPEAHDAITPHDLPKGHPARAEVERQARELGGATPGHREGAAERDGELVGGDERDGARLRRG